MSQNWTDDVFALSHEGETDLQNIENNFQAMKSLFSGATFGLSPVAGQPHFDTNTSILGQGLLKIRNRTNSGWLGVLALAQESSNGLVWFHGNDMSNQEGWVIDTSITQDRVMALKNHGSGTYTTGRQEAGQWNINDLTIPTHADHIHSLAEVGSPATTGTYLSRGICKDPYVSNSLVDRRGTSNGNSLYNVSWDTGGPSVGLSHSPVFAGTWRIKAQVGIVIYPDI